MTRLETVETELGPEPTSSVIWLHGLGADGHDFEAVVPQLGFPADAGIRFVFPHAPMRPVTINNGVVMRAWYDILSFDRMGQQDEEGVRNSAALLEQLIEREYERGSAYERIVLAGFSQGGAVALHAAVRFPRRLAGVLALSTYLPLSHLLEEEVAQNRTVPPSELSIFMAHGILDPVLPIELGLESKRLLEREGFAVDWHEYGMAHAVCPEEIMAVRNWLSAVLATGKN